MAYNSFFFFTINYSHLVWGTTFIKHKQKLIIAQKKAVSIISNVPAFFHTNAYFEKFNILKHSLLYRYTLTVTYRTAARKNNTSFLNLVNLKPHNSAYHTINDESWTIPTLRTSYRNQSSQHILPVALNHLLCHVITLEGISSEYLYKSLMAIEPL